MKHAEHSHTVLSKDKKVNALLTGVSQLVHSGELTDQGFMMIGPKLGLERRSYDFGIYGEDEESDSSYFDRLHEYVSTPEGVKKLEAHYGSLESQKRQALGRAINEVRERGSQQERS